MDAVRVEVGEMRTDRGMDTKIREITGDGTGAEKNGEGHKERNWGRDWGRQKDPSGF